MGTKHRSAVIPIDKTARLLELARQRQAARWPGYAPLAAYHGGAYERDLVSPYTAAAGNVNATVMILLQDWASDDLLQGPLDVEMATGGFKPSLATNKNLRRLLGEHFERSLSDTYATNLFPFIKPGGMSAPIRMRDLVRAAREFAIPQIEIIAPRLAICLGLATFNAVRLALGISRARTLDEAIGHPFSHNGTRVWCQAHTGSWGQNLRGRTRVAQDWHAMRLSVANT